MYYNINNMTDEERRAIEGLFHLAHINTYLDLEKEDVVKISRVIIAQWKDKTEILLNLIKKQSKEIEELKEKNEYLPAWVGKKYVSKDKIKAKIEELKEDIKYSANPLSIDNSKFGIKVLQSLLKEEE